MTEQEYCAYCHTDSDGCVQPIDANGRAYIWKDAFVGYELCFQVMRWRNTAKINYCPMCGRRLTE